MYVHNLVNYENNYNEIKNQTELHNQFSLVQFEFCQTDLVIYG